MDYKAFVELFNSGYPPELIDSKINNFFIESCKKGHLEVAKWLWKNSSDKINIHENYDYVFRHSCQNGQLVVAKWLWDISDNNIDIHALDDDVFRWSCLFNQLDVAKWLWEISGNKINIHTFDDFAFRWSCENGHFVVAKWLWIISKCTVPFSILKNYAELAFLNTHSKKYRYKYTHTYDNLHIIHYYYKPIDGPGYLNAINF